MRQMKKNLAAMLLPLLAQTGYASAEQATASLPQSIPGSGGLPAPEFPGDLPPAYPEWPERTFRTEIVPPPPGGPYMSSALTEINVFPHDTGGLRYEYVEPQMESPFFSADMPWPDTPERDRPQPWYPESGQYNYVPEEIVRQLESPSPMQQYDYARQQPFRRFPPPPPPARPPFYGY